MCLERQGRAAESAATAGVLAVDSTCIVCNGQALLLEPTRSIDVCTDNTMDHNSSLEANISSSRNFPAFYGIRVFITVFTKHRHLSVSSYPETDGFSLRDTILFLDDTF